MDAEGSRPSVRMSRRPGNGVRITASLEIVLVGRVRQQADGVCIELLAAEGERDNGGAWDEVTDLAVVLRSGYLIVDYFGINLQNNKAVLVSGMVVRPSSSRSLSLIDAEKLVS